MSKLQDLIKHLCPDGVPYKSLGEVCDFKRGQTITEKDAIEGNVPVIAGGQKPAYFHNTSNRTGETIAIAGSGAYAGFVSWWTIPVYISDAFTVHPNNSLLPKFVYYYLLNIQQKIHNTKKGCGVPHVHGSSIAKFEIPIPPLEVQEEIVKILDRFTAYAAELQAELQARKEQYEYYRNLLLTFNPSACGCGTDDEQEIKDVTTWGGHSYEIQWKKLGDIMEIKTGKGITKSDAKKGGNYPIISGGKEPMGYYHCSNRPANTVTISRVGAYAGFVSYIVTPFYLNDKCFSIIPKNKFRNLLTERFLYFYLKNKEIMIKELQSEGGVPTINTQKVGNINLPILPIELQEKIVSILDRFETLVNDLTDGLPAEIEAVKEQYEYYRNKLLTFKQLA